MDFNKIRKEASERACRGESSETDNALQILFNMIDTLHTCGRDETIIEICKDAEKRLYLTQRDK